MSSPLLGNHWKVTERIRKKKMQTLFVVKPARGNFTPPKNGKAAKGRVK